MLARLRDHYAALPPSERKLADLILDFPGDIASYSATELTRLAGVSKAAASRLFRRIGYANYQQARRAARHEQDWGSPLYGLTQRPDTGRTNHYLKAQIESELANMLHTFEALDLASLDRIAKRLLKADRVWLTGHRHSHYFAGYACWQFLQVRDHVYLLPGDDTALAEHVSDLGRKDVLVAIGFRRRTSLFLRTLKLAHGRGIPILYLTEPNVGASVNYATWLLHAVVSRTSPFDSYPAVSSLIHLLSIAMLHHAGLEARTRLSRIEEMHKVLRDFE